MKPQVTMRSLPGPIKPEAAQNVSLTHELRARALRRRSGRAWVSIPTTAVALAAVLRVDPSSVSHRRAGKGHLANLLMEVDALERGGFDCTPIIEAVIATALEARGAEPVCPKALAIEETALDHDEDRAQIAWLAGKGSLEAWRQAWLAYIAHGLTALRALGGATT